MITAEETDFRDARCSFCDRHDRDVRLVARQGRFVICQTCVARCAEIIDEELGRTT